jgi:hypothetical protein
VCQWDADRKASWREGFCDFSGRTRRGSFARGSEEWGAITTGARGLAYNRLLRRLEQFLEQRGLGNSELAAAIRSPTDRYPLLARVWPENERHR